VTNYANFEAGYSHVYSLFAITTFIYFAASYFKNKSLNHFILACLFFGLILILRQINILIIFFVPFLAGSMKNLKDGFLFLLANPKKLLVGILSTIGVFSIQSLLWYLQAGSLLVYSYQGESFNFLHPHMINILFSYKKGLFVYTPILFISLFSLIWLAYNRKYYWSFSWVSFFIILTYVYSSWWTWSYGASFGMRALIDYYSVFFIPFAFMLDGITLKMKLPIIILSFLTIPINIIQTYQYKEFILHWGDMDKVKYWKIFLRTDDRFKGVLWKNEYNYDAFNCVKEISLGNITVLPDEDSTICRITSHDIPDFNEVSIIQVMIDNEYNDKNDARIIVSIKELNSPRYYYWMDPYLIHFSVTYFNEWQTGLCDYQITPLTDPKEKLVSVQIHSGHQKNNLSNIRIRFLKLKFPIHQ
jgi:hypothetical protein